MRTKIVQRQEDLRRLVEQYKIQMGKGATEIYTSPSRCEMWIEGQHVATIMVSIMSDDKGK